MWPFKKKSAADRAIEAMPGAIQVASEKWVTYNELPFKSDVSLQWKIMQFMVPFEQYLRGKDAFKDAPDAVVLLIVCKGVELSGTHSRHEIEDALDVPLPD